MLQDLYKLILEKTDFLYTVLFQTPFFFFDIWSIVHFFTGGILMLILAAPRVWRPLRSQASTYSVGFSSP